ncbi:hypothetical protein, partial [Burkholderia mallei]|uniref:hypothetical protein n=1 Tax=Burkholderia mallei TaxID=13373 RepID=UPI001C7CB616
MASAKLSASIAGMFRLPMRRYPSFCSPAHSTRAAVYRGVPVVLLRPRRRSLSSTLACLHGLVLVR